MEVMLVDKYRPKEFKDVVGLPEDFEQYVKNNMQHLLFTGPQGTGKTTVAKIIANKLNSELLEINASKDNGVDMVRNTIEPFCKKCCPNIKIVFLDEADNLSLGAQKILRRIIEDYQKTTKFILACNYPRKLIEPIRGRMSAFEFHSYKKEEVLAHIKVIAEKENIKISDEVLELIVKKYKSDIRSMIHLMNRFKTTGEIKKEDLKNTQLTTLILVGCKKGDWSSLRTELLGYNIDYFSIFAELDERVFNMNTTDEFKRGFNRIAAKYDQKLNLSFNKEMCFAAFLDEIMGLVEK